MAKYGVRLAETAAVIAPAAAVHTEAALPAQPPRVGGMLALAGAVVLVLAAVVVRSTRKPAPETPATGSADYGTHDDE